MKKIIVKKELICPFNKCRIAYGQDKEGNEVYKEMGIRCENCNYMWNRLTNVISEITFLNEDSKEYKEYEFLHTPVCVKEEEGEYYCEKDGILKRTLSNDVNEITYCSILERHQKCNICNNIRKR